VMIIYKSYNGEASIFPVRSASSEIRSSPRLALVSCQVSTLCRYVGRSYCCNYFFVV